MRFIRPNGEVVDITKSNRLSDPQLLRVRSLQMLAMRRHGQTNAAIAMYFSKSPRHVARCINSIPEAVVRRVDGRLE